MIRLFSKNFDTGRLSDGEITLTEQGDAPGNMANSEIICLAAGTRIATASGARAVEQIRVGEQVRTFDGQEATVKWRSENWCGAGALAARPKLAPISIAKGALGGGLPSAELSLSRQHWVLLRSRVAFQMYRSFEVFVPAHTLLAVPGVSVSRVETVRYCHLLTDRHTALLANDAPCESLYVGAHLQRELDPAHLAEVQRLVAEGEVQTRPMRPILSNSESRHLIRRILGAGRAAIDIRQTLPA